MSRLGATGRSWWLSVRLRRKRRTGRCRRPALHPSVVAAPRHLQRRTPFVNRGVGAHRFYPFKTLSLGAEMMPGVFFRICPLLSAGDQAGYLRCALPHKALDRAPPPPVLRLERLHRANSAARHRLRAKPLLPLPKALHVDSQLRRHRFGGLPAARPVLHRRSLEALVIPLPFRGAFFVVHGGCVFNPTHSLLGRPPNRGKGTPAGIGICMLGNYNTEAFTAAHQKDLEKALSAICRRYKLTANKLTYHQALAAKPIVYETTDCPGSNVIEKANEILDHFRQNLQ